jgi:hypothetical protein
MEGCWKFKVGEERGKLTDAEKRRVLSLQRTNIQSCDQQEGSRLAIINDTWPNHPLPHPPLPATSHHQDQYLH